MVVFLVMVNGSEWDSPLLAVFTAYDLAVEFVDKSKYPRSDLEILEVVCDDERGIENATVIHPD